MNIYEISSYFYDEEECDNGSIYDYLLHEKQFSKEEFIEICEKGLNSEEIRDCFCLKKYLIDKHGFKAIKPLAKYEFEER